METRACEDCGKFMEVNPNFPANRLHKECYLNRKNGNGKPAVVTPYIPIPIPLQSCFRGTCENSRKNTAPEELSEKAFKSYNKLLELLK